ncbi:MAG TPA: ceramidase domain-containing protein [Patescibacteria group bacterium]|nr:ceramidase domain-containing protein [Patescibacteria group bacterium]
MKCDCPHRTWRIAILFAVAAISVIGTFLLPPIAQDLAYHDFADKRGWLGIPNFGDVMGNIPFAIVGLWGLAVAAQLRKQMPPSDFRLWLVFFAGVFLVAFGSGYYHIAPDNHTLVWDRLPMTIAFMSLFSIVIRERVNERWGNRLFPLFIAAGLFSVWYWDHTEALGQGDLRPYALVQFFPIVAILLMISLFPARNPKATRYLFLTLGWYIVAKLLEHFDPQVFAMTGGTISGHTIKHVAAAVGVACMIPYMRESAGNRSA